MTINEEASLTQTHRQPTPAVAVKGATTKTIIAAAPYKGVEIGRASCRERVW